MGWRKLGLVYRPRADLPWQRSHAANPAVLQVEEARHRVYFASRDGDQRSHVGWFEVSLDRPTEVVRSADTPALAPGPPGHFDDSGVYASSIVEDDEGLLLYYTGWNRGPGPLFYTAGGLARSRDGGRTFERVRQAPILDRSEHDPWMVSQPVVRREGQRWRMWYLSGLGWSRKEGRLHSRYHVKYAESEDGLRWERSGTVAIDFEGEESNIARPSIHRDGQLYRAWFPHRTPHGEYRIGYAESTDGIAWRRGDSGGATLGPSEQGWDSRAVTYPWVVRWKGELVMFYNGNDHGRAGLGVAVRDDDFEGSLL